MSDTFNKPTIAPFEDKFFIYRDHSSDDSGALSEYMSAGGTWFNHMKSERYPSDGGTYFSTRDEAVKIFNHYCPVVKAHAEERNWERVI
jgi:hypothetical protein